MWANEHRKEGEERGERREENLNEDSEQDDYDGGRLVVSEVDCEVWSEEDGERDGDRSSQAAVRHHNLVDPCELHQSKLVQYPRLKNTTCQHTTHHTPHTM